MSGESSLIEDLRLAPSEMVVAFINQSHGLSFSILRRLYGGFASDTYLLIDSSSEERAVLKWSEDTTSSPKVKAVGPIIAQARAQGYPTPRWIVYGATPEEYPYVVQEFVPFPPGSHLKITAPLANAAVEFLDKHHTNIRLDTHVDWVDRDRSIVFGGVGDCVRRLRAKSSAGADFVDLAESWTRPYETCRFPSNDLVHGDFQPGNFMISGEDDHKLRIASVVDVEAVGRGTRLHDLADLFGHCVIWDGATGVFPILNDYAQSKAIPGEWEVCLLARLYYLLCFYIFDFKGDAEAVFGRATAAVRVVQDS